MNIMYTSVCCVVFYIRTGEPTSKVGGSMEREEKREYVNKIH